jgi:hypothetical protein
MKKLTFSKSRFFIFEVKKKKIFSLEHALKSAGVVNIIENYRKICFVCLKIVCRRRAAAAKKTGEISENFFQTLLLPTSEKKFQNFFLENCCIKAKYQSVKISGH